jgi:hypothetical protein
MPKISKPAALLVAAAVAFGLPVAGPPSAGPAQAEPAGGWAALQPVRTLELGDHGVSGGAGVAWSERLGALVVLDESGSRRNLVAVTGDEFPVGTVRLPRGSGGQVAVDPDTGAVTVVGVGSALSVSAAALRNGATTGLARASLPQLSSSVDGVAYDARGDLVVLHEGALVRPDATGPGRRTEVATDAHDLRGLALHPETGELLTLDVTGKRLLALDGDGTVTAVHDASAVEATELRSLAVGPSGDTTDAPSTLSIYIADAGEDGAPGTVLETRLEPVGLAASYTVTSSQVRTVDTSAYDPPSPDPSGVAYLPGAARLFIADGEVDEMKNLFAGSNFFATNLRGEVQDLGVSQPWSNEPVGVGYNPTNDHLFVSDDDQKEVFEVDAGDDARFGTSDDTVTHFDTGGFGNTDPEGVDYDPASNSIWLVDGVNAEVFRVRPGGDGRFGTSDDVRAQFDVGKYGARDPEGIGYDSARDTIVIVDDSSDTIYELDKNGALLNAIDTSAANMTAAAGVVIGPSSSGSGRSYYVVARGQDNDSNPDENDGRLYEISLSLPALGQANQPPVVDAGVDQSVVLPDEATLSGSVSDDGEPDPPGTATSSWSQVSGPGAVSFADPSSPATTASFPTAGSYVLRLTATDGSATVSDDVTVSVSPAGGAHVMEVRVQTGSDDAEQTLSGWTGLSSSDLELTTDGSRQQVVGMRFAGLQVPAGATVTNAYVQFRTDESSTGAADLTVRAEAADNTPTYRSTSGNVTSRETTAASVAWSPPSWSTVGEAGGAQRTPDLSKLVQAVVDRPGWTPGNALALQVSGTGRRTAEAFDGGASFAPLLHVEYTTEGSGGTTNAAPTVDVGADRSVTLPDTLALDATVSDDGLPTGSSLSYTWSEVSGPGDVTFTPAETEDTTAAFSTEGSYVLRLTVTDGELTASDDVSVTVGPAGGGSVATGEIEGVEIESHDHLAPVVDGNGNLYRVTEDTVANGNRPRLMKSSDGGRTWVEQDVANRPTTGDTEGGWMLQDGPTIWFAWQKSAKVHLTRFRTSDHPTSPDTYEIQTENVASPSSPGPQYASLARNTDGSLWIAYGDSPSGGPRSAVVKRESGGGYGEPIVIDSATSTTAPRLVKGDDDLTHVFYKDHTNHRVYWRTLTTAGLLSAPVRVDSAGTSTTETAITNAVSYTDAGVEVLVVAFAGPTGVLRSVEIRDGVVQAEQTVSSEPVTINPGNTTNLAAVAHLAVAGTTVVAMWSDAADGHVYRDVRPTGGAWGEDLITVDTGTGTAAAAWYVYANVLSRTSEQARVAFTYDLGPHADEESNIMYDEVSVPLSGSGGGDSSNTAPLVNAGSDQEVTLSDGVTLDATVTDDGRPSDSLTYAWSQVSGPGTVAFSSADSVDTTATFSQEGTFVLRLTAHDGELSGADEVTVVVNQGGAGSANTAPTVELGADRSLTLPDTLTVDASVADDGLPSASLTYAWSQLSGPGTVAFAPTDAEDTTASFSEAGDYVLRLTVSDGELSGADDLPVAVAAATVGGGSTAVDVRIAAGSDDAEQRMARSGSTLTHSSDLELTTDGKTVQVVGMRFAGLQLPQGATITDAYLQFHTDETSTGVSDLTLRAEAVDNAETYQGVRGEITARTTTAENVPWAPPAWNTVGEAGAAQRTPDLSSLIQAVVTRPGWVRGNALALQITGTGHRAATSFDGGASFAPLLHVEYSTDGSGGGGGEEPVNVAPDVDAGPDRSVTLPASVSLDATVTDDGVPSPPALTYAWSQVSGPGEVAFSSADAEDTSAAFSVAGSYVLRLSAYDGQLTGSDDVTVSVSSAGEGGGTQVTEVRVAAETDDVEQALSGTMEVASSDLELTMDGRTEQVVGLRFAGLPVPHGATVTDAWVQFVTDEVTTGVVSLTLRAEAADDAATYQRLSGDVTSRTTTAQSVAWSPTDWTVVGAAGEAQRTPDLSSLVQAVVSRPGWAQGNALALQISGTGRRTAVSHDTDAASAPLLHVEYTVG